MVIDFDSTVSALEERGVHSDVLGSIEAIRRELKDAGYPENCALTHIICSSLQHLGKQYLRYEDTGNTNVIDCSTLTSSSHWEGALIGIPFTSEGQRTARNAERISLPSLRSGDVVIKYRSLDESPDKTYNHVGLFLGRNHLGVPIVIESNSRQGCVLSDLAAFDPQDGGRRFIENPVEQQDSEGARVALELAPRVPKLGRLGAKQYRISGSERSTHPGLDIYVPVDSIVYSPIEGEAKIVWSETEQAHGIQIMSLDQSVEITMLHAGPTPKVNHFRCSRGEAIGVVLPLSKNSDIRYSAMNEGESHLHFEVKVNTTPVNGLLFVKRDIIASPLATGMPSRKI